MLHISILFVIVVAVIAIIMYVNKLYKKVENTISNIENKIIRTELIVERIEDKVKQHHETYKVNSNDLYSKFAIINERFTQMGVHVAALNTKLDTKQPCQCKSSNSNSKAKNSSNTKKQKSDSTNNKPAENKLKSAK